MVLIEAKCLGWIIYVLVVMERQSSGTFLSRLFSLENPFHPQDQEKRNETKMNKSKNVVRS